jgi:PAS domain S-box-containing protein
MKLSRDNIEYVDIKSRLVNISLIIASLAGLPLLFTSLIRAINMGHYSFFYVHIPIYLVVLAVTLLRKKLNYSIRALSLILLVTSIGVFDFLNVGFLSAGFLSFTVAVIIAALYFNVWKALILMTLELIYVSIIYILFQKKILVFNVDYDQYVSMWVTPIMLSLNIVLYGLIIAFSLQHIQKKLSSIIQNLRVKTSNLEETTIKLQNEIKERYKSELKAINSEKNFRNIFDKSSDAIIIVSPNKRTIDFNEEFMKLVGKTENEIMAAPSDKFIPDEDKERINGYFDDIDNFPARIELKINIPGAGLRFFDCTTSIINYNGEKAILFMIRDYTERLDQEKKNYLTAIKAEEKERSRFSKELHDGLGPLLSTLKIYLDVYFSNPDDKEIIDRIQNTLGESIKSVKEISNNLSPYVLENMGLSKAIESFIERIKFSKKFEVEFTSNLDVRLRPEIEISVYRFVTELINNTIKHANASMFKVNLVKEEKKILIEYSDNGVGFDINDVSITSKGIGLLNLKSRIENLGGKIDIITSKGKGFSVIATLTVE